MLILKKKIFLLFLLGDEKICHFNNNNKNSNAIGIYLLLSTKLNRHFFIKKFFKVKKKKKEILIKNVLQYISACNLFTKKRKKENKYNIADHRNF